MREARSRRTSLLGWAGVLCCLLGIVALTIPGIGFMTAATNDGVRLGDGEVSVELAADTTYGIYVNDADNSGYSEHCSVEDADGRQVRLEFPPWSISGSDTEMLDYVFDSGSGKLTIDCAVPGEQVTARQVPNFLAMLIGFVLAGVLGIAGLGLISAWYVLRPARAATGPMPA